jgi:RNA polymerase sigma-70 factor (ECF subfamily)
MTDKEIIDLYWRRDEAAIAATADTYGKYCHSIAYHILRNEEDAEECVNDTWLNAWKSIPPQRPQRLSTYLGKLTRNLSLNRHTLLTAQKRGMGQVELTLQELEECVPASADLEQIAEEMVLVNAIEVFLRSQSRTARNIFVGRYWYLYSIRELADTYSMSESKVVSLLFRMRKKLKLHLEKEGIFL